MLHLTPLKTVSLYCTVAMWCCLYASSLAVRAEEMLPSGYEVVSGKATFQQEGNRLDIEASSHAVINYQRFDIGQSNQVNIHSPVSLHRVVSNQPSQILGQLNSTGHVFLVNQNGIVFGKNAQLNVGSLTATTLDLNNAKFTDGHLEFGTNGSAGGSIQQQGTLQAREQINLLSGTQIDNSGDIQAANVNLGVGQQISMQLGDHVNASITVDKGIEQAAKAFQGIQNSGSISANQVKLQTRMQQAALKQTVNNTGIIEATGFNSNIVLDADGSATVSGTLTANSSNGQGGSIELGADALTLNNATIEANGSTGGGRIRIGGEYLGGAGLAQDELRNAQHLMVDEGTRISANSTGTSGDGGQLVLWSDRETHVAGQLEARGGSQASRGGFIETSGKERLNIADTVRINTRGVEGAGTWLLDPENIVVANSGGTVTPGTLIAALATSNVTLNTNNPGLSEAGDITFNNSVTYNSANSFNILGMGNVRFNRNVVNNGSGDVNVVAGWNGTTGLNAGLFDMNTVLATPTSYGNNNGSVTIADVNGVGSPIAVGSANGKTQVAASSLFINGGTTPAQSGVYAQLGYAAGNSLGDINVYLKDQLRLNGGSTDFGSARIGHGGNYGNNTISGNISIRGAQNIVLQAGNGFATDAKIGHGGLNGSGTFAGNIDILNIGSLQLVSGGTTYNGGHAQVGHAGANATASATGNIRIEATGDVSLQNQYAAAIIGHGTYNAHGVKTGDINISAGNITLNGANGQYTETHIGHGGGLSTGNATGNITLTATDQIKLLSGNASGAGNRMNIGHGVLNGADPATGNRQGNITLNAGGELSLVTGGGSDVTIGHSTSSGTTTNTDVFIKANSLDYANDAPDATSFTLANNTPMNRLLQNVNTGHLTIASTNGNVVWDTSLNYTSPYAFSLLGAGHVSFRRSVQNGGAGDVNVVAGWDKTTGLTNGLLNMNTIYATPASYGQGGGSIYVSEFWNWGDGAFVGIGSRNGATGTASDQLVIQSANSFGVSGIGFNHRSSTTDYSALGNIKVNAKSAVRLLGGTHPQGTAMIGHYLGSGSGTLGGTIEVNTNNVELLSGASRMEFAPSIGHSIRYWNGGGISGNILVNTGNVYASANSRNRASIGHKSDYNTVAISGNIDVNATGNVTLDYNNAGFQIGHGGLDQNAGTRQGTINLNVGGELSLVQGTFDHHIGHSSDTANAVSNSHIYIKANSLDYANDTPDATRFDVSNTGTMNRLLQNINTGNLTLASTNGNVVWDAQRNYDSPYAFSLLGANDVTFGRAVRNLGSGVVNVVAGWDKTTGLTNGLLNMNTIYATPTSYGVNSGDIYLGSSAGPAVQFSSRYGNTNVAASSLFINGAGGKAQLGNSNGFNGTATGDINVYLNDQLKLQGGSGTNSLAQIGHGYPTETTTQAGNILIHGAQNVELISGTGFNSGAQIGHGGYQSSGAKSGSITLQNVGNISLQSTTVGNRVSAAHIGHGGEESVGTKSGHISISSTGHVAFNTYETGTHIGHGGWGASGDKSGDITLVANSLSVAPTAVYARTQIGHGGGNQTGNNSGNISLTTTNDMRISSGSVVDEDYSIIGHGGAGSSPGSGLNQGNISLNVGGELSLVKGSTSDVIIGHNTSNGSSGISNANLFIKANSLDYADDAPDATSFTINSLLANQLNNAQAGGNVTVESTSGTLSLVAGWVNNTSPYSVSLISAGGMNINAPLTLNGGGTLTLDVAGDLTLNSGVASSATGRAITAVSRTGNLFNTAGASGLQTPNGFWVAYSGDNLTTTTTGLTFNPLYQHTYTGNPPSSLGVSGNTVLFRSAYQSPPPVVVPPVVPPVVTTPSARAAVVPPPVYTLNENQNAGLFVSGTVGQWSQLNMPIAKPAPMASHMPTLTVPQPAPVFKATPVGPMPPRVATPATVPAPTVQARPQSPAATTAAESSVRPTTALQAAPKTQPEDATTAATPQQP